VAVPLEDPAVEWPSSTVIDRPTRLLLALTQASEELAPAASALAELGPEDTQRLITLLRQQRLAPWVAYQLQQAGLLAPLPEGLRQVLERATAQARHRTARQRLALLHTLRCLGGHGIAAVALKGSQLAWQHYPQPWLRPMRDLDLLLPEEQIGPAFALLESKGFRVRGEEVRRPDDPLLWRVNDFSLFHPSGAFIELHRSLWFRPGETLCGDFSLDPGFWGQEGGYRMPPDPDGITYLQPPYLTLHCLVHHLLRQNMDMGPLGLVDLQWLQAAGHLDHPVLAEAAGRLGCTALLTTARNVLAGWRQTRWLSAPTVPSWVLPLLMSREQNLLIYLDDRSVRSHARQWLAIQARGGRWSGPAPSRPRQLANLARGVALLPRLASKAGVVEQLRRRWRQPPVAGAERQLAPALVAATRELQALSRGQA
jgi:Uncharacterised nucleotidyltransferase